MLSAKKVARNTVFLVYCKKACPIIPSYSEGSVGARIVKIVQSIKEVPGKGRASRG